MSEQWQVTMGPCTIQSHPTRPGNGILLITKTECVSGESEMYPPRDFITKAIVEDVVIRHGKDFLELIANFQKFILGMITVVRDQGCNGDDNYSCTTVDRCYELNRIQRLSLLKYLANEIVSRACELSFNPKDYPTQGDFDKLKGKN